jgi:hypothetical protein
MRVELHRSAEEQILAQAGIPALPNGWTTIKVGDLLAKEKGISGLLSVEITRKMTYGKVE